MIIKNLNTFFHRNSRWLFGAFTIVIIVSFLGFLTPGTFGFGDMSSPESIAMGSAYGEKVTWGELRNVSRNFAVFSEVFYNMPMSRELPQENVFIFACMARKAKSLGLAVSDNEVAELIARTPAFMKNGSFEKKQYAEVLKNLRRNGITEQDLYEACRQQLLIEKLQRELTGGVTVTDNEAEELYRKVNALFSIRVIEFPAEKASAVKVSAKEVQDFFARSRARYQIPGKINVLAIEIPYTFFNSAASKLATDKALKAYFDRNKQSFTTEKVKNPEFAAVKAQVKAKFIADNTRELAMKKAYDFATSAYERLAEVSAEKQEKLFRDMAAKANMVVIEAGTAEFGAASVGKIKSRMLIQQLSGLNGNNKVTDPIPEEKAVYIGFLRSRVMPRAAEYKEVAAKVKSDCQQAKALDNAGVKAAAVFAELAKAKAGETARILAKNKDCRFSNFDFSIMTKTPPEAYLQAAVAAVNLKVGGFSAPVRNDKGAYLAQLVKRTPADMKAFAGQKEQYIQMCRQQKVQLVMQALQDEFAANCRFTGNGQNNGQ